MMREILFRGKRRDNGEWVEGHYAGYDLICPNEPEDIYNATGDYHGQTPYVGFVEVDPATVGQFTGLTDKNGKRIFEGDIVKEDDVMHDGEIQIKGRTFLVTMTNGCWFGLSQCNKYYYKAAIILDCLRGEVIGNIHDNPELLEERL